MPVAAIARTSPPTYADQLSLQQGPGEFRLPREADRAARRELGSYNPTRQSRCRVRYRDHETLLAPQEVDQYICKTRITVGEHAGMPGPRSGLEYGGKAVHGDQCGRQTGLSPPIQFTRNPVVIGLKYLSNAASI